MVAVICGTFVPSDNYKNHKKLKLTLHFSLQQNKNMVIINSLLQTSQRKCSPASH